MDVEFDDVGETCKHDRESLVSLAAVELRFAVAQPRRLECSWQLVSLSGR